MSKFSLYENYSKEELLEKNANFLGLKKRDWSFSRGARFEQLYTNSQNETVIKEVYEYSLSNGGREIDSYVRYLIYFKEVGLEWFRTDTTPDQTPEHIDGINQAVRVRRVNYLERAATNLKEQAQSLPSPQKEQFTFVANSVQSMYIHYAEQIRLYKERVILDNSFEDAVNSETNSQILQTLNTPARSPDQFFPNGLTVKGSVLYQLTGVIP